jgi:hypothetical protein
VDAEGGKSWAMMLIWMAGFQLAEMKEACKPSGLTGSLLSIGTGGAPTQQWI